MRWLEAGLVITAIGLVIVLCGTIVSYANTLATEEPARESTMNYGHGPAYIEVQCDAFDIDIHPHDEASKADAEEFAEQFSMSEVCHESR